MHYDVIVIGAGLGGLTAGAKLAKEGRKVLVLEQHDRAGGCATTFRRRDFTMEVGLHEMDGLHPGDGKNRIFEDLGLFDRVDFLPLPAFYRFLNPRTDLVMPHDPEEAKAVLKERFPDESEGIDAYFSTVTNARRIAVAHRGKPDKSVGAFLDEIIRDKDLKLCLLGNLGYFHDDPYSLSWLYYINAQGSYFGGRANYIRGGSQVLSNALADIIREHGGEVKLNMLVTGLTYKDGHPTGVLYHGIRGRDRDEHADTASDLVVNASLPDLADLLSPADGKKLAGALKGQVPGASLLTVYYGFSRPLKEINPHYSTFIYDQSVTGPRDILANNHSDFRTRSFTFVDYSHVDAQLAPEGKSVGAICAVDYLADWESLSKEEYEERKNRLAEELTDRCEAFIPGFRDAVEYAEVGTARTVRRFIRTPGGAVYGFSQHPGRSLDYLDALPANVHVASAWGKTGGGFSGAILGGYLCAMNLLRRKG
ncbi:MAG: NAD(P)/FAD-dependent oxidoreductase [Bacteroidales bacterium]